MDNQKTIKKNLWMFPLGAVGRDMLYNLVTNFLLTFILFSKGLTAAQLAAITAIMVFSTDLKGWDFASCMYFMEEIE